MCVSCEKVVCLCVCVRRMRVKDLRVKEKLCVNVLLPTLGRWAKFCLPSDAVQYRAGRSAITRMRTDWPVHSPVASKAQPIARAANRPCCQCQKSAPAPTDRPMRRQATLCRAAWHRSTQQDMKWNRDVFSNKAQETHAQRRGTKRCKCFFQCVKPAPLKFHSLP